MGFRIKIDKFDLPFLIAATVVFILLIISILGVIVK